jgi:hypothetical protein
MEKFVNLIKQGVVSIFVLGLFAYSLLLAAHALGWGPEFMKDTKNWPYVFGLPISGIGAFAIVCVLEQLAPATNNPEGKLEFKAFGLTFSGPAGPITLWVVCYLTLVASIQIVKS